MVDSRPKRSWRKRALFGAFAVVVLTFLGLVIRVALTPPFDRPPLPSPNGMDDLVAAGEAITGTELVRDQKWFGKTASEAELRAYMGPNRKALERARTGLGRKIGIPLGPTVEAHATASGARIQNLRKLGRLLACEGYLARKEGRHADAIRAGVDLVHLGHEAGRGGMMIDNLAGQAISAMGIDLLRQLPSDSSTEECRETIRALEAIDAKSEPIAEVMNRDYGFGASKAPLPMKLALVLNPTMFDSLVKPAQESTAFADARTAAGLRLLVVEFALRAYRLEQGNAPETLDQLVHRYLSAVPDDPFRTGGGPLVYRNRPSGSLLYSVGPDGVDDGGAPMGKPVAGVKGDLTLDAW